MNRKIISKIRVLAVGHDVGGAQVLLQAVKALKRQAGVKVDLVVGRMAQKLFARHQPRITDEPWSEQELSHYFDLYHPDLLLTSTSWKSNLEQSFRNYARVRGIPSVVLMDFWSNYRMRWQHANYPFEEGHDHVCAMDKSMARALQQAGYPSKKIHVIGHPHLEHCSLSKKTPSGSPRQNSSTNRVLLLSIPLAAIGMQDDPLAPIRVVCAGLAQWHASTRKKIVLSIRQHPHEKKDPDFISRARSFAPPGVSILLADNSKPVKNNIRTHDFILGYVTMVLFEARAMGKQAMAMEVTPYASDLKAALKTAGIKLVRFTPRSISTNLLHHTTQRPTSAPPAYRGAATAVVSLCLSLVRHAKRTCQRPASKRE